jgi:hypothetical protein
MENSHSLAVPSYRPKVSYLELIKTRIYSEFLLSCPGRAARVQAQPEPGAMREPISVPSLSFLGAA